MCHGKPGEELIWGRDGKRGKEDGEERAAFNLRGIGKFLSTTPGRQITKMAQKGVSQGKGKRLPQGEI